MVEFKHINGFILNWNIISTSTYRNQLELINHAREVSGSHCKNVLYKNTIAINVIYCLMFGMLFLQCKSLNLFVLKSILKCT